MSPNDFDTICSNGIENLSDSILLRTQNKDSDINPESFSDWEQMKIELRKTFLGQYYLEKSLIKIRSHTSTNITAYVEWVLSNVQNTFQYIYLYLFGILTMTETPDPLIYFENCLQFLRQPDSYTTYDFNIFNTVFSGPNKFAKVLENIGIVEKENPDLFKELKPFIILLDELKTLYENNFRNAIAHGDYRVESNRRIIVYSSGAEEIYDYETVELKYNKLSTFLTNFYRVTSSYSSKLIPGYDISFSRGPRY